MASRKKRATTVSAAAAAITLVLVVATPLRCLAHDYWFEADGQDYLLMRGHRYGAHKGEKVVAYDPSIVVAAYCAGEDGRSTKVAPTSDYPVKVAGPCAALLVRADSGYWSQTLTGTQNKPKDELFGVLRSWHSLESVKLLESWNDSFSKPLSDGLELVSRSDPFAFSTGEKLRLVVMYNGKPRQGVTVAYDGEPRGVTGKDGRINLRIRHLGMQRITASVDEAEADGKADKLVRSTVLLFELVTKE